MSHAGYHFTKCQEITEEIKAENKSVKRSHSGRAIGRYWIDSCHRKGLVDGRLGSGDASEVILLKNSDNLEYRDPSARSSAAATATATAHSTDNSGHNLNQQLTEEKKCPSLPDLNLFGNPSEIDNLLAVDGTSDVSASEKGADPWG